MITLKYIREHFKSESYEPRHCLKSIKRACNRVGKSNDLDPVKLFHLLIENRPVNSFSHSYGFQTGYGRSLVEELQIEYYNRP